MPEDRTVALMWAQEQAQRCPACGTYEWEWKEDENAWTADAWTCQGCRASDRLRRQLDTEYRDQPLVLDGVHVRFYRGGSQWSD